MAMGRLKFFNQERGFGFIVPDEYGPDAYVSIFALEAAGIVDRDLTLGQRVEYLLVRHAITQRLVAENLKLIKEPKDKRTE
jgi:CspA family cold shock protein